MRPTCSHEEQGGEAFFLGKKEGDNPYLEDSLGWLYWLKGFLESDIEAHNADDPFDYNPNEAYLDDVKRWLRNLYFKLTSELPSVEAVAERIKAPLDQWPGNCFGISLELLESGLLDEYQEQTGKLFHAHGMYVGPIARDGHFGGRPAAQHAWLESPNGHVVDPTRWVFSNSHPTVWAGDITDYDLAGSRLRRNRNPYLPKRDEDDLTDFLISDKTAISVFDRLTRSDGLIGKTGKIGNAQLRWIANLPLEDLGSDASCVYSVYEKIGLKGFIPIDNVKWLDNVSRLASESKQTPSL